MTNRGWASVAGIATCIVTMGLVIAIFHPASDLVAPAIGGTLGWTAASGYLALSRRGKR